MSVEIKAMLRVLPDDGSGMVKREDTGGRVIILEDPTDCQKKLITKLIEEC